MATTFPTVIRQHVAEIAPYDPDAQIQGKTKQALTLMAVLVFGLGLASAVVPIGGAVIGSGQVGVDTHIKKIAHPIGGTIAEILVENGQHVKKGQLLIRLDDKVSGSEAALSALSVDQMVAQKARLEAEQSGAASISFPADLAKRTDPSAIKAMADERRMFTIRQAEQAGIASQLTQRIAQYHQQISGIQAQIASLRQQSVLIAPERQGLQDLYAKKLVTIGRLNQLERTAADLSGSIGSLTAQIAQAQAKISETREQIIQLGQTRRAEAGTQLAQINAQLNQQQIRQVSAMDARDRTMIRAPYDGVVDKLAFATIGGVIRPAEEIMEIVPDRDEMLVEGSISPADVDQVRVGQPARVRFSSVSSSDTPEVRGRLLYVGANRVTDPDGRNSYYPVRIALDPADVKAARNLVMKPGMPAELFVETGRRSMMSYITKPLRDQLARAFRDN